MELVSSFLLRINIVFQSRIVVKYVPRELNFPCTVTVLHLHKQALDQSAL